jgi:death-on-curing protein
MITESDILLLHEFSIVDYGGANGLRDRDLLLSAISRPFQTFGGQALYSSPFEKAAALGESLIINHPFMDGNKRTALLAMLALLQENGIELSVELDELYSFVIGMAMGERKFTEIVGWLQEKSIRPQ